jgi:hypothetical protein
MRKMSSRSSMLTHFLPAGVRCRERHPQYNLNPALCQRATVSAGRKSAPASSQARNAATAPRTICLSHQLADVDVSASSDELLPQSQVLQEQIAPRTRTSGNKNKNKSKHAGHTTRFTPLMKEPTCHAMHLPHLGTDHHFWRPTARRHTPGSLQHRRNAGRN